MLDAELQRVDYLATQRALPDAEITDGGLKVVPIVSQGSEEIDDWAERAYALLPRIRVTDLLHEVDHWTHFTQPFTHLRSGETTTETRLLLTAILADAINLGPTRMAFACPGTSLPRLIQTADWYVREETHCQALAEIVKHHHQLPLALEWGRGKPSSSDAQRFPAGAQGEATGRVNARLLAMVLAFV